MSRLSQVKFLIYFLILAYIAGCGRNFKTLDPESVKSLENPPATGKAGEPGKSDDDSKKEPVATVSDLWVKDIPTKYDDVGDFFRIKEVPGLNKEQVLDSRPMGDGSKNKTLKLIRGKLRLSKVSHHFDSVTNQLEVKGDVVFDDGNPRAFVLVGPFVNGEIPLKIKDDKSSFKDLLRAKAACSSSAVVDEDDKVKDATDFCRRLTIDFYYRYRDTFYTDQLISKDILYNEIKKTENVPDVIPDPMFENIPDEDLSDYEKAQKKGLLEGSDPSAVEELPYYFLEPSIDDVATLYPDVSKEVEEQKKSLFNRWKKIKAVPKLTGEEKISEKDKDQTPVKPTPTPIPLPKPPVKPSVTPRPAPKPPVVVPNTPPADRPVDQAWGMPHTGILKKASSLLEAWQKLGVNAGFEVRFPLRRAHYGAYDIVDLVVNIGEWVRQNVPGLSISVSDISGPRGGQLGRHSSHKNGLDIDIAYLTKKPKMTFMNVDVNVPKGDYTHPDFNAADQWRLIKAAHDFAPIQVIYVNRRVKQEMCRQALIAGDLKSNKDIQSPAASILTKLIVIDKNHGNHWHVRLDCKTLKDMKLQTKCGILRQPYVGPECHNIAR